MIDPICSIVNLRNSIERYWFEGLAKANSQLLISKENYSLREEELKTVKSGFLWALSDIKRTHHWEGKLWIGATAINDFNDQLLWGLTDKIKYQLDQTMYLPIFDYAKQDFENSINQLVLIGPIKFPATFTEPNGFRTNMFIVTVKYAQTGYL